MDIFQLEGFLVAILIGPKTIMPSAFMHEIWGGPDAFHFESITQAQKVTELLMKFYNYLNGIFMDDPGQFEPTLPYETVAGKKSPIPESWCSGFMQGVGLAEAEWMPLFKDKGESFIIAPLVVFGTARGAKVLEDDPAGPEIIRAMTEKLGAAVRAVHNYWLPERRDRHMKLSEHPPQEGSSELPLQKPDRNAPCPCGSGKKFKHCHGK